MSYLIWIYTVCPPFFDLPILYSLNVTYIFLFSLPERSSLKAIALPSASCLQNIQVFKTVKFLCDGQGADRQAILFM